MAVNIVKPGSESVGARRASAPSSAEPVYQVETQMIPDPEVSEGDVMRRFTAKYKFSIQQQAPLQMNVLTSVR